MKVSIGRIVIYKPTTEEIEAMENDSHQNEQQELPAIVVADWGDNLVNLRVMTDGHRIEWKTSIEQGDEPGQWNWPKKV